jgi:cation diffusion facilitator CzcD-associated flavoprotein CzcO
MPFGFKGVLALAAFLAVAGAGPCRGADVVVYGATPGGIVTAVRAAREGLKVTLVSPYPHVGGMLSNGLLVFDTMYQGRRAPLYDEVYDRITSHYPANSIAYARGGFEPHVAEEVFESLPRAETHIKIYRSYYR